jgi:hypothetical protein
MEKEWDQWLTIGSKLLNALLLYGRSSSMKHSIRSKMISLFYHYPDLLDDYMKSMVSKDGNDDIQAPLLCCMFEYGHQWSKEATLEKYKV